VSRAGFGEIVGIESSMRVAVVGAGLAGLGAAWRLAGEGCDVVLLEREGRAGGRAVGTDAAGFAVGGRIPLLRSEDRNLLGWIAELGLGQELLPLRTVELAQLRLGGVRSIDPRGLAGIARIPGVSPWSWGRLLRLPRLMDRYRPLLDPSAPERAASLDFRSAADFGRLYFGRNLFERWIAPTLTSVYLSDARELSRAAFLLEWMAGRALRFRVSSMRVCTWRPKPPLRSWPRASVARWRASRPVALTAFA
jgi:protoporphyrinogen oxidase